MKTCRVLVSWGDYCWGECKKPAKFRAPEPTNGVEFVCGIHARAFNKYYERKGKSIRCEPISREEAIK
jgi:hypothetical protein